jgi:hypothetical protein
MRLLRSQSQIPRTVRLVNSKVTTSLLIADIILIALLAFFVYQQPRFIFKKNPFHEKSTFIAETKHVLRQMDSYKENAIQADILINDISRNKFIIFPQYKIVRKSLMSCPQNKCDEKLCKEPDLKTGENIWCVNKIIKERKFANLETMDFKIYRRIFPQQYKKVLSKMDLHGKGNRRGLEYVDLPVMNGLDRLKKRLSWGEMKSFVSGSEYVAKISFQEVYYKIKVRWGLFFILVFFYFWVFGVNDFLLFFLLGFFVSFLLFVLY